MMMRDHRRRLRVGLPALAHAFATAAIVLVVPGCGSDQVDGTPVGSLVQDPSGAAILLPPGVDPTGVSIRKAKSPFHGRELIPAGDGYTLEPSGRVFEQPVTVRLPIDSRMLADRPGGPAAVRIYTREQNETAFADLPTTLSADGTFVEAQVGHFSEFQPGLPAPGPAPGLACTTAPDMNGDGCADAAPDGDASGTWVGSFRIGPNRVRTIAMQLHQRGDGSVIGYVLGGTSHRTIVSGCRSGASMGLQLEMQAGEGTRTFNICGTFPDTADMDSFFATAVDGDAAGSQSLTLTRRPASAPPLEEHRFVFYAGSTLDNATAPTDVSLVLAPDLNFPPSGGFVGQEDTGVFGVSGGIASYVESAVDGGPDNASTITVGLETGGDCPGTGTMTAAFHPDVGLYFGTYEFVDCHGSRSGDVVGKRSTRTQSAHAGQVLGLLGGLADLSESADSFASFDLPAPLGALVSDSYLHSGWLKLGLLTSWADEWQAHPSRRIAVNRVREIVTVDEPYILPQLRQPFGVLFHDARVDLQSNTDYRDEDTSSSDVAQNRLRFLVNENGTWRFHGNQLTTEPVDSGTGGAGGEGGGAGEGGGGGGPDLACLPQGCGECLATNCESLAQTCAPGDDWSTTCGQEFASMLACSCDAEGGPIDACVNALGQSADTTASAMAACLTSSCATECALETGAGGTGGGGGGAGAGGEGGSGIDLACLPQGCGDCLGANCAELAETCAPGEDWSTACGQEFTNMVACACDAEGGPIDACIAALAQSADTTASAIGVCITTSCAVECALSVDGGTGGADAGDDSADAGEQPDAGDEAADAGADGSDPLDGSSDDGDPTDVSTDGAIDGPTCSDGVKNGAETDVDCGGSCAACGVGAACDESEDCASGVCATDDGGPSVCLTSACDDGLQNGDESGIDCGGSCDACPDGSVVLPVYTSCGDIHSAHATWTSGIYVIAWDGGAKSVYCDMVTDGGGWTSFFAGTNGQANVFAAFETDSEVCSSPIDHCLRRLPATVATAPELLVTCGSDRVVAAAIRFGTDTDAGAGAGIVAYFQSGTQAQWQALSSPTTVAGTVDASLASYLWTGDAVDGASDPGWIVSSSSDIGTPTSSTFASSYGTSSGWDYCAGASDTESRVRLSWR